MIPILLDPDVFPPPSPFSHPTRWWWRRDLRVATRWTRPGGPDGDLSVDEGAVDNLDLELERLDAANPAAAPQPRQGMTLLLRKTDGTAMVTTITHLVTDRKGHVRAIFVAGLPTGLTAWPMPMSSILYGAGAPWSSVDPAAEANRPAAPAG